MSAFKSSPLFQVADEISEGEVVALSSYKDFSCQINDFLRGKNGAFEPDQNCFRQLDSAIRKSCITQSVLLFRATFNEDFDRFVRAGIFQDPAYISTSLNESNLGGHFVSGFSRHPIKLMISIPQGANAFYLEPNNDSSESESECLLPRCGRYRITSELSPITGTNEIAKAIGHSNWYHSKDFDSLRIIELTLLVA